jgi:hypothetical protein
MTEKVPLEAMLRRASRMAENMFERDGEVTAFLADGGRSAANYPGWTSRRRCPRPGCGLPTSRVLSGSLPQRRRQGRTDSCSH